MYFTFHHMAKALLTAALAIFLPLQAHAIEWTIRDLGTLPGGDFTVGTDLNDLGQVVGYGDLTPQFNSVGERIDRPFGFISGPNGGALKLLDTGPSDSFLSNFIPAAVNNLGQVVGTANQGSSTTLAFVTGPNGESLNYVTGDFSRSVLTQGVDINESGSVLYQSFQGRTAPRVIEPDGTITTVTGSEEDGIGRGYNNNGQVVFDLFVGEGGATNGMVWSPSAGAQPIGQDGVFSRVFDINNAGQILGIGPDGLSIVEADGVTINLLTLPDGTSLNLFNGSVLPKLNDAGQVVGNLFNADRESFAFVTAANGNDFINLETLPEILAAGWTDLTAYSINNLGQIAGSGIINGKQRPFFLAPVPEPETWAMLLTGFGLLVWTQRRRLYAFPANN